MKTDRFDFELVSLEEAGTFSRDVTAAITNTSEALARDVDLTLDISAAGEPVESVDIGLGDLEPAERREIAYTLTVSPTQGVALLANGADLDITIIADGQTEQAAGTIEV